MTNSTAKAPRKANWRKLITEQERSGLTVRRFCEQQGIGEQAFYQWRRRLRNEAPVRFALVETASANKTAEPLELILATGERLRIAAGVDVTKLRAVLEALRA